MRNVRGGFVMLGVVDIAVRHTLILKPYFTVTAGTGVREVEVEEASSCVKPTCARAGIKKLGPCTPQNHNLPPAVINYHQPNQHRTPDPPAVPNHHQRLTVGSRG